MQHRLVGSRLVKREVAENDGVKAQLLELRLGGDDGVDGGLNDGGKVYHGVGNVEGFILAEGSRLLGNVGSGVDICEQSGRFGNDARGSEELAVPASNGVAEGNCIFVDSGKRRDDGGAVGNSQGDQSEDWCEVHDGQEYVLVIWDQILLLGINRRLRDTEILLQIEG